MTATVTGATVGSFNFSELTPADIVDAGLRAGIEHFRTLLAEGKTRGRDLAIRGGYMMFIDSSKGDERTLVHLHTIGVGDYPQYNPNLSELTGKLSTVVRFVDHSDYAYPEHREEESGVGGFFGNPETDPRTWPGGVFCIANYVTPTGRIREQEFAIAASGDWGQVDKAAAQAAGNMMAFLWGMQQRLADEAAVAAKRGG